MFRYLLKQTSVQNTVHNIIYRAPKISSDAMRLFLRLWPWKCLWNDRNSVMMIMMMTTKMMMMMMIIIIIIIIIRRRRRMKTVLIATLRHPYHPSFNVMTINKINKRVSLCWLQKYQCLIALLLWSFPRLRPFVVLVRVVWKCKWLRGLLECYCRGTTEVIEENPVPVPLCPPKVSHGLTCNRVQSSGVRVRRLPAWAVAWNFED
jgi:hypothetical protein